MCILLVIYSNIHELNEYAPNDAFKGLAVLLNCGFVI